MHFNYHLLSFRYALTSPIKKTALSSKFKQLESEMAVSESVAASARQQYEGARAEAEGLRRALQARCEDDSTDITADIHNTTGSISTNSAKDTGGFGSTSTRNNPSFPGGPLAQKKLEAANRQIARRRRISPVRRRMRSQSRA